MISADSYYSNGSLNKGCQDYALYDGGFFPIPYIIICDGCSSSMNTDVGARLLAHASKKVLRSLIDEEPDEEISTLDFERFVVDKIKRTIEALELSEGSMDSTILISFIRDGYINTFCFGDGQIFIKYKDGHSELVTISYKGNAPYYLSYQLNKDRLCQFISYSEKSEVPFKTRSEERIVIDPNGSVVITKDDTCYSKRIMQSIQIKDTEFFLLMSDGSESFVKRNTGERVDSLDIIKEFSSFKNINGEFIKRRVKKAMETLASKNNIHNTDDVSVAGFYFSDNN